MNASTAPTIVPTTSPRATHIVGMRVGDETCLVRAVPVWPIAEVLDFEEAFDGLTDAGASIDPQLIADALDSQMIAAARPRRRRERAVSSRAHFYAGG